MQQTALVLEMDRGILAGAEIHSRCGVQFYCPQPLQMVWKERRMHVAHTGRTATVFVTKQ